MHLALRMKQHRSEDEAASFRKGVMNNEQIEHREMAREAVGAGSDEQLSGVIRVMRRQLGMTQEELAQALGITVGTVSRWEKGRFRPSRLARALIVEFARSHNVPVTLKASR
jgi:DNA-binding transcriptional regulator YiaG